MIEIHQMSREAWPEERREQARTEVKPLQADGNPSCLPVVVNYEEL